MQGLLGRLLCCHHTVYELEVLHQRGIHSCVGRVRYAGRVAVSGKVAVRPDK